MNIERIIFNLVISICLLSSTSICQPQPETRYSPNRNFSPMTHAVADRLKAVITVGNAKEMKIGRFMKIGDSITANSNSFGQFVCIDDTAKGGNHAGWEFVRKLDSYGYLHDAVEFFNQDTVPEPNGLESAYYLVGGDTYYYNCTSYNRDSKAARVSMAADWPLSGNPSPLAQEISDLSPAFAIIMYGANDMGSYGDDYSVWKEYYQNMLAIADSCIERGIVPILTATCPNLNHYDRTLTASHIIRCMAQGRQVPFINFFRAALPLPDSGMGGDGVHPSTYDYNKSCWFTAEGLQYGFNMRNLVTMQELNNIYQIVGNNKDSVDAPTPALAGSGSSSDPFIIDSLAFVDTKVTTVSNPAYYYRLTLTSPLSFRGLVFYQGSVDITIELLDGSMGVISSSSEMIEQSLSAGTYYIKLNTVSGHYGEFQFIVIDRDDTGVPVSARNYPKSDMPSDFLLFQNYPNPFNPSTKILFSVGTYGYTSLKVFDILGREIATLVDGMQTAGEHTVEWDGKNSAGQRVGSGIYFYRLSVVPTAQRDLVPTESRNGKTESDFNKTRKMILLD